MVHPITSLEEFRTVISSGQPVVIDYWATWCGPCRVISPIFEGFATKFGDVGFYKVDVDTQEAISQEVGIRAMPTFHLYVKGNKEGELVGANPVGLEALLNKANTFV
ncbi:thioredoxin [Coprinopsis marcescibilis]|uniref:Thioredoxin n=1 Tax=Coprinopsis marcescibilis TaxID=230819 RepID=A0A5C3KNE0_COPMA|nr:thioredoxin [Coprinopsis marcescibilis]